MQDALLFLAYLISLPVMITAIVAIRVNQKLGRAIETLTRRVDLKASADVAAFNVLAETAAAVKVALSIQEDAVKLALQSEAMRVRTAVGTEQDRVRDAVGTEQDRVRVAVGTEQDRVRDAL